MANVPRPCCGSQTPLVRFGWYTCGTALPGINYTEYVAHASVEKRILTGDDEWWACFVQEEGVDTFGLDFEKVDLGMGIMIEPVWRDVM
jgi:hypothetical protein